MGFFRKLGLAFVIVLLSISLLLGNVVWIVSSSLEYDNVRDNGILILEELVFSQAGINLTEEVDFHLDEMRTYCDDDNGYSFDYGGYKIEIPCENLNKSSAEIIEDSFEELFSEIYYKDYECDFWDCFGNENSAVPLFLISQKAKNYWTGKFYWLLSSSLILLGASFLLFKRKRNFFIISGVLILLSAIPFANLEGFFPAGNVIILSILRLFTISSRRVFSVGLVMGISFILFGILLYISKINIFFRKIFGFFKKEKNLEEKKKTNLEKKKDSEEKD
jgi:hypothetical protein